MWPQAETLRVRPKYLKHGFLALVFMIGTLAGAAGGFLVLPVFRSQAAQTDMERALLTD